MVQVPQVNGIPINNRSKPSDSCFCSLTMKKSDGFLNRAHTVWWRVLCAPSPSNTAGQETRFGLDSECICQKETTKMRNNKWEQLFFSLRSLRKVCKVFLPQPPWKRQCACREDVQLERRALLDHHSTSKQTPAEPTLAHDCSSE